MLDTSTQGRFTQSCSDAAYGYVNAATAACASMTSQTFGMWTAALRSIAPAEKPEPRSWYRHPDERANAPLSPAAFNPFAVASAMMQPSAGHSGFGLPTNPWLQAAAADPVAAMDTIMAPWTTWLSMWSGPRAASAWPMACFMIAGGLPRAVAVPAAEANAAVIDAANQIASVYSSYHSDSGYASAQIVFAPPRVPTAARAPVPRPVSPMWPWLH